MILLFSCTLLYIFAGVLQITGDSFPTAIAEEAVQEVVWELDGIIIREESVIPAQGIAAIPTADDGQAVAAGAEIAVGPNGSIPAPCAGIYVRHLDGYEYLTPQIVSDLSPTALDRLQKQPASPNLGKLITDHSWQLAVTLDDTQAAQLQPDSRVVLTVKEDPTLALPASVIHISTPEQGRCTALFRCTERLDSIVQLRKLTVFLTKERTEGLRIPIGAVHTDEAGSFIYIRCAHRAEKYYVTILSEEADAYIVSKDSSANALRAGDTVILGTPTP